MQLAMTLSTLKIVYTYKISKYPPILVQWYYLLDGIWKGPDPLLSMGVSFLNVFFPQKGLLGTYFGPRKKFKTLPHSVFTDLSGTEHIEEIYKNLMKKIPEWISMISQPYASPQPSILPVYQQSLSYYMLVLQLLSPLHLNSTSTINVFPSRKPIRAKKQETGSMTTPNKDAAPVKMRKLFPISYAVYFSAGIQISQQLLWISPSKLTHKIFLNKK